MSSRDYRTVLCQCSQCVLNTFLDEFGREQRGMYQRPRIARNHQNRDTLGNIQSAEPPAKRCKLDADDQENCGARILLASALPHEQLPTDLPVRLRDKDTEMQDVGVQDGRSSQPHTNTPLHESTQDQEMFDTNEEEDQDMQDASSTEIESDEVTVVFRTLSVLQSELCRKSRRLPQSSALGFICRPTSLAEPPTALDPSHHESIDLIALEDWLRGNNHFVDLLDTYGNRDLAGRVAALKREFRELDQRIQSLKMLAWEHEKLDCGLYGLDHAQSSVVHRTDRWYKSREYLQPFLLAALFLATVLHSLAAVSRVESTYVLATIRAIIYGAFVYDSTMSRSSSSLTYAQSNLLNALPIDIRTVLKNLDLEPEYRVYACCARCLALYPPDPSSPQDPYPHTCTHQPTPGDPVCEAQLVRRNPNGNWVALKTFPLQSLRAWLGQLLSRSGIEEILEKAWIPSSSHETGVWTDIMQSPAIQQFVGPDGRTLFSQQRHGSLNLVFSLFVDWFNPFGNKTAGKSHSIGAVYMACLNLPPELRYRTENIFLAGIIPGPHEPSLEQLNHFLTPLVDEMLILWHRGVYLSRTAARITGRLVQAAIIPLVCDLPALRKVAGFAAFSSKQHFCSFCRLPKTRINDLDRPNWLRRSWAEHLDIATRWRDASTSREREQIFDMHGLRWSELLRLPYWDPTRYALVDAMHNLYLGELRHHCREVLGIDIKDKSPDSKKQALHSPEEQAENLTKVVDAIRSKSASAFKSIRRGYIVAIADLNGVIPEGTTFFKKDYVEALLAWHKTHLGDILVPPVLEESTAYFHGDTPKDWSTIHLLDNEVLQELWADMSKTFTPSWVESAPRNFGSVSHGKLKAAQWRSVCTINMIITLIRIWAPGGSRSTTRRKQILNNFVDLVLAVEYATRRSMSHSLAASFDAHIYRYLQDLHKIFEHDLLPNHHMALHLRECMELFGPVHAWWAFPFERYNGLIAQLKSNNKSSDMPLTFLRYFCIGSSIRSIMSSLNWPDIKYFRDMLAAYHAAFGNTLRGIFTGATQAQAQFAYDERAETILDEAIYDALLDKLNSSDGTVYTSRRNPLPGAFCLPLYEKAQFVKKVVLENAGLTFGTARRNCRNSFILFRNSSTFEQRPGQIESIFYHRRLDPGTREAVIEPFYIVKPFEALSDMHALLDPYRLFPGLNTSLFYKRTSSNSVILHQKDIVSHFAAYFYVPDNIGEECVVVRSLDRA